MRPLLCLALTLIGGSYAAADTYLVVPNNYQTVVPTGTFTSLQGPKTLQFLVNANQLTAFVGQQINGFAFRQVTSGTTAWPTADATYPNYNIFLSESVAPANRSLTFLNNIVGIQTQVRSGPLTIPGNAFPPGNTGNFGPDIAFDTPYLYTGGHLLMELRFTTAGTAPSANAALASQGPGNGYGVDFSGCWSSSFTATSGSQANFTVTRFRAKSLPVTGIITLSDYVGAVSAHGAQMKLTAVGSTTSVFSAPVTLNGSGQYTFEVPGNVASGSYDLYADGSPFLRRKQTIVLTGSGASGVNFTLPNGDCDNSGEVDAADIDVVIANFGGFDD